MGIGVGGGKEYVCKREVGQKILPHFGGGSVLMLGQRHAEQHHKHAQQVAGQDAHGALFIERARGWRWRAGNRGMCPREEEQKTAQRQKRLHQHIAAAHQPVEILTENGRVEPRLLPDVEPHDDTHAQRAKAVGHGHIAFRSRTKQKGIPVNACFHRPPTKKRRSSIFVRTSCLCRWRGSNPHG